MLVYPSCPNTVLSPVTAAFDLEGPLGIERLYSGWVMVVKLVCLFSSWFLSLKNLASSQIVNQCIQLQMLSSANWGSRTQPHCCWTTELLSECDSYFYGIQKILAFSLWQQKIREGKKQTRVTQRKGKKMCSKDLCLSLASCSLPLPPASSSFCL